MSLRDGKTDSRGDTLSERTGGDLNAWLRVSNVHFQLGMGQRTISVVEFGVARGLGVDLTEGLEIVQRELVSQEVEQDILERATGSGSWSDARESEQQTYPCLWGRSVNKISNRRLDVPVGQHKAVPVEPMRVLGVGIYEAADYEICMSRGSGRSTHREKRTWATAAMPIGAPGKKISSCSPAATAARHTWVARVRLGYNIGRKRTDGGDGDVVKLVRNEGHGG